MAEERLWKRGRTLGKGSFGFVSLASPSHSNAVSLDGVGLPSLFAVKSAMRCRSQSLQQEVKFLGMFEDSSYVIRCFGFEVTFEDQVMLYNLFLEYASSGSLADILENHNYSGLPESEVRKHTKSVLLGLNEIHDKGVVHCDIKPDNILIVGDDEIAKIADFGLALTFAQIWTQKQGLRGTKRYMAPESVLKNKYGPESDVWALGCTVYELITGTPLWQSDEDDVLYRIRSEVPMYQNAKLSCDAQDFLKGCLDKNPDSRWTPDMLLKHPFVDSCRLADNALPPKKRKPSYKSLSRPHKKRAFRTEPHVRNLIITH